MKKWEFTGEEKVEYGIKLKRIRAKISFTLKCGVKIEAGEEGGWIEKEKNLSDNAWVFDNACVSGDARVFGDAWVSGDARVFGDARVSGNAHYFQIGPAGSRNDYTTFTRDKAGTIYVSCGCFYGTIDAFREKVKQTHGDNKHAKVYLAAADLAELQIDTTPKEDDATCAGCTYWDGDDGRCRNANSRRFMMVTDDGCERRDNGEAGQSV